MASNPTIHRSRRNLVKAALAVTNWGPLQKLCARYGATPSEASDVLMAVVEGLAIDDEAQRSLEPFVVGWIQESRMPT